MNPKASVSAHHVINTYSAEQLHKILGMYGEIRNAKTLATGIISARANQTIDSTSQLIKVLEKYAPRGKEFRYYAQVFQAIRIEVNEELIVIEEFLTQIPELLKPDGRLVVLTFHSLEDRPVKNFIRSGKFSGEVEKDFFGNEIRPLQAVNRKPIEATSDEIIINSRSRSAKLRIAEPYNP
jgi:16S rRNA (cytosine1402-N4)-methyltransferase